MEHALHIFSIFAFFAYIRSVANQEEYEARVMGGETVQQGHFPWNALMMIVKPHDLIICEGALISPKWILTAGHCAQDADSFAIILGSKTSMSPVLRVFVHTDQYILHENYSNDGNFSVNNIALIKLLHPVEIIHFVKPVDLSSTKVLVNTTVTTSGRTTPQADHPALYSIKMVITSDGDCRKLYDHFPVDAFCAKPSENGKGCMTESGGPVTMTAPKGPLLVGIHIVGSKCTSGSPNGFVSTYYHREWIRKHTGI